MKAAVVFYAFTLLFWSHAAPVPTTAKHAPLRLSSNSLVRDSHRHIQPKISRIEDIEVEGVLAAPPDNRPYSPSGDATTSQALSATQPLETTYLISLGQSLDKNAEVPQPAVSVQSRPVMPAHMTYSSIVREETGTAVEIHLSIVELETEGNKPVYDRVPCKMHPDHFHLVRRFADMSVVGIVFILITIVIILELCRPSRRM
ncbi:hypothetical protein JX266_013782 [Neoarthrinium moseri]|nr:hypothetical protein JX266_013782 [Neoarthrinium moseri]